MGNFYSGRTLSPSRISHIHCSAGLTRWQRKKQRMMTDLMIQPQHGALGLILELKKVTVPRRKKKHIKPAKIRAVPK